MEKTVLFRDFEERDIEFVYKCKNDEKLNSLIVGEYHPFTHEEAEKWVHGCMGEHDTFKFWAICTNDDEKSIIGWVSISNIDRINRSACHHGIVIGDPTYQNGLAWIESSLFVCEQVFETMNLNRLYGSCRVDHKLSMQLGPAMFKQREGTLREAVYKNGKFIDIAISAILAKDYFEHKAKGDFEIPKIIRRLVYNKKKSK